MDNNELRIGNFILNEMDEIISIDINTLVNLNETYKPIKLTNDIMLNLGFKKEKVSSYGGADMWAGLGAYSYGMSSEWIFRCAKNYPGDEICLILVGYFNSKVVYLHQLQNLFYSLYNIELIYDQVTKNN